MRFSLKGELNYRLIQFSLRENSRLYESSPIGELNYPLCLIFPSGKLWKVTKIKEEKKLKYPKGNPMKIIFGSELDYQSLIFFVKKEIFDDIVKEKIVCDDKKCTAPCCVSYRKLKERHLSTFSKKKKEHNRNLTK